MAARAAAVIRIDAMWLAVHPVDLRCGPERLLAHVVQVFGAARSHHEAAARQCGNWPLSAESSLRVQQ
jgi:hypothetical protein